MKSAVPLFERHTICRVCMSVSSKTWDKKGCCGSLQDVGDRRRGFFPSASRLPMRWYASIRSAVTLTRDRAGSVQIDRHKHMPCPIRAELRYSAPTLLMRQPLGT